MPARIVPAKRPVLRLGPYRGSKLFNGSGRVLDPDAPACTIAASIGGNAGPVLDPDRWAVWYHRHLLAGGAPVREVPTSLRRITPTQAARLQGFAVDRHWPTSPSAAFNQVGNAVPPLLACAVAAMAREGAAVQLGR